jgi:hypothetical protein
MKDTYDIGYLVVFLLLLLAIEAAWMIATHRKLDLIEAKLQYMDEQLSVPIMLECPHREPEE